ncbi:class A beta-lactamase-related serine hydrolase [Streptococcus didelphis]|uniref:serine hydrolase n=1 Tax=Streptococcus didelphis TaxID=102886 RepID=UPI0003754251|nr:serine hydrolase [Streptococcus didelphis]WMB29999.1 class A beta-lactamase-related serine hydrolase [Streptococcus didelphis]
MRERDPQKEKLYKLLIFVSSILCLLLVINFITIKSKGHKNKNRNVAKSELYNKKRKVKPQLKEKSKADKEALMAEDLEEMSALGLYYDYANLNLVETVKAYLKEYGIEERQIAFSYKDLTSGKTYSMNETQAMTAGSTYKLPLNMLVVDEVEKGNLSLKERFDIRETTYEYDMEHKAYVAQFQGAMTIPEMQEYSLLYSENTPAYALAERLGGLDKAFESLNRYGESRADIKTIQREGNKTTSDYYIKVLDYLWKHREKYKDLLYYIGESFPNEYYKTFLPELKIYQKPGYVNEALNVDAIVCEESPYLIALYTANLGGTTESSSEISGVGYNQLVALTYVINQWHRVNHNR